jgi:hypothetical protein
MYGHCRQASYVFGDMAACDLRGSLTPVPIGCNFIEWHLKRNGQANQPHTGIAVRVRRRLGRQGGERRQRGAVFLEADKRNTSRPSPLIPRAQKSAHNSALAGSASFARAAEAPSSPVGSSSPSSYAATPSRASSLTPATAHLLSSAAVPRRPPRPFQRASLFQQRPRGAGLGGERVDADGHDVEVLSIIEGGVAGETTWSASELDRSRRRQHR